MAQTKTPAMILQEYTVKSGISSPEYNLIHSKTGTHENEFHYQVIVNNVCTVGFGRSKQVAKHDAAQKALALLQERGLYKADSNADHQEFKPQLHRNESDNPAHAPFNYVGHLKDWSVENKVPYPIFKEISDVGPPHARQFTYECQISSVVTIATANTKKQAKQLCAKEMITKIKSVFPEIIKEQAAENAITESDENALNRFASLSMFPEVVINKALKIKDYDKTLRKLMEERSLEMDDFSECFETRNEESFKEILTRLDLTYKFMEFQENPVILSLAISLDVPFTLLKLCDESKVDNAKLELIAEAFDYLELYMSSDNN